MFKLRFRRRVRHGQKHVEDLGVQAEATLERHFFRRLANLGRVWRFIAAWVGLILILAACLLAQMEGLSSHYQTSQPVAGGTFTEGLVGTFTNANPLYATSSVDTTVSRLLFAGLFTYDDHNKLVGSLASSWDVNDVGTVYTVHLKPNLTWQDGKPLTADDVVFTYKAIQNPDAQSALAASWQGITAAKKNSYTVTFTLPNPLSSFPYNLTNGIIPAHVFARMPVTDWRSAAFNSTEPIGAGPFKWSALQVQTSGLDSRQILIALQPFDHYQGGKPKLTSFVVHTFNKEDEMLGSFRHHQLTAIGMQQPSDAILHDATVKQHNFLVSGATMAFFNVTTPILSDVQVRQALVQGVDTKAIIRELGYTTRAVREPLLVGQLGYDPKYAQTGFNPVAARALLDKAGWVLGSNGQRTKAGKPLQLMFFANNTSESQKVGRSLAKYWGALGVKLDVRFQSAQDFQATIDERNYDIALDSIAIGADPDVFVYWDSTQTDARSTHLNLSNYKSATADAALEAGRTRLDPGLRVIKYRPFLQAWQQDAPALGLYQPRYLYLTHQTIYGLNEHILNSSADRLNNVQDWMIRTAKVTNP